MTNIVERLREWPHGHKTMIVSEAIDEIERLRNSHDALVEALQFIADGYENHNVNHVDYRVKVYQVALDALARVGREQGPA